MRLDHLLSTEFFQDAGLASVVRPMRRERFPVSRGRAGVEEIVGFAGSFWGPAGSGADMLLGSRTATRDLVARGFPDVPGGMPSACGPLVVFVRVRGGLRTG